MRATQVLEKRKLPAIAGLESSKRDMFKRTKNQLSEQCCRRFDVCLCVGGWFCKMYAVSCNIDNIQLSSFCLLFVTRWHTQTHHKCLFLLWYTLRTTSGWHIAGLFFLYLLHQRVAGLIRVRGPCSVPGCCNPSDQPPVTPWALNHKHNKSLKQKIPNAGIFTLQKHNYANARNRSPFQLWFNAPFSGES